VVPRSIGTVANFTTKGLVTTRRVGHATIRASKGNRNDSASLTVH
jgi:hypothetical protein